MFNDGEANNTKKTSKDTHMSNDRHLQGFFK